MLLYHTVSYTRNKYTVRGKLYIFKTFTIDVSRIVALVRTVVVIVVTTATTHNIQHLFSLYPSPFLNLKNSHHPNTNHTIARLKFISSIVSNTHTIMTGSAGIRNTCVRSRNGIERYPKCVI